MGAILDTIDLGCDTICANCSHSMPEDTIENMICTHRDSTTKLTVVVMAANKYVAVDCSDFDRLKVYYVN